MQSITIYIDVADVRVWHRFHQGWELRRRERGLVVLAVVTNAKAFLFWTIEG